MSIKKGDIVIYIGENDAMYGKVGTVKREINSFNYAVEFQDITWGHGCSGNCRNPHGWWCNDFEIKLTSLNKRL